MPSYINLVPKTDTLDPGESQRFTAEVLDQYGNRMDYPVVWDVSDTAVIKVDTGGVVEAWRPGHAYVRAFYETLSDSAFVVVDEPTGTHDLYISARLLRTDTSTAFPASSWLRLELREDDSTGPYIPGARVYLLLGRDTLLDTMTTAEVLWASGLDLKEGEEYTLKVLFLGRFGQASAALSGYRVRVLWPEAWDSVPSGQDLVARWDINAVPMAKDLALYRAHDFRGQEPVYYFYTENLMAPDTGVIPKDSLVPGEACVVVSALDKRDIVGYGSLGTVFTGKTGYSPIYVK